MNNNSEGRDFQAIPENTGLDKIHENRSGIKLEIVIPVFNEENRIGNILRYYKEFDIVLLDDGSTDRTIEMAVQAGASVYRRLGEAIGENHFTYYNNKLTKSGRCFYMMTDEFISKRDLKEAAKYLETTNTVIGVRKINWIYGEEPKYKTLQTFGMPRGFRRGDAAYNPSKMHDSLQYTVDPESPINMVAYNLHHLHIRRMKDEFGKMGRYLYIEIEQMLSKEATLYDYLRRFIVPIAVSAFWRVWFNKTSLPSKLFRIMELIIFTQLAIMCWIEQKFMPTSDEQMADYSAKYFENKQ